MAQLDNFEKWITSLDINDKLSRILGKQFRLMLSRSRFVFKDTTITMNVNSKLTNSKLTRNYHTDK